MKPFVRFRPLLALLGRLALLAAAPLAPALAQGVGIGTTAPDASAALDIRASGQGLLVPRLTQSQRLGIAAPATGLLVFQTDGGAQAGFWFNAGSPTAPRWTFINPNAAAADNLGNHTATTTLNLQANALVGTGASIGAAVGLGVRADGGLNIGQNAAGQNIFVGHLAGESAAGIESQLIGIASGRFSTGNRNHFSGYTSGNNNRRGEENHFEGFAAGLGNVSGSRNQFVGFRSGTNNLTGQQNYAFGYQAGPTVDGLVNAGAIGYQAQVSQSNSLVLGNGANVGVGTSAPAAGLHINRPEVGGNVGGAVGVLLSGGTTGSPNMELRANNTNLTPYIDFAVRTGEDFNVRLIAAAGTLNVQSSTASVPLVVRGQAQATSFGTTSDQRLKTNLRPLTGALAGALALRGVRYQWNAEGQRRGGVAGQEQIGLLAQEVEKVYPELVTTGADGYKAVNYAQLAPVLIEALKEQQRRIETIQTQVAALQAHAAPPAPDHTADHAALLCLQAQVARLRDESAAAQSARAQR